MASFDAQVSVKVVEDLTVDWLSTCLNVENLESFTTESIGTGQLSECFRVHLRYAPALGTPSAHGETHNHQPRTVILKVTSRDPTSRASGVQLGIYKKEVLFYTSVADSLGAVTNALVKCHHAAFDGERFCLLLSDASPATPGNDLEGIEVAHARSAVTELAKIHITSFNNAEWETLFKRERSPITQAQITYLYGAFMARYQDRVSEEHRSVCEKFIAVFDAYGETGSLDSTTSGLVHGDYRPDNMLFGASASGSISEESNIHEKGQEIAIVDWQTITWGSPFSDLSYFLGCALQNEHRRTYSPELIQLYHKNLGPDSPYTLEQCYEGVRRHVFFGVTMAIVSAILAKQTDRGDEMFLTLLDRHCAHALDLHSLDILPKVNELDTKPLMPKVEDEASHKPGPEELWNESWYFDVADVKSGVGAYVRLGTYPNQGKDKTWYTAVICGPGRPTIAVLDFEAPLPDQELSIKTDSIKAGQKSEIGLELYHVSLEGKGEVHDDPAAILRGEKGKPTDVTLDLRWKTAGTPYQYRITTRYEIPCSVTGTIKANGETFTIDAAPGQRDHSWGVRDWWSMDWVWQTVHLNDGTHIHGLDLRVPEMPKMYMG
jgi:hypothetical protein